MACINDWQNRNSFVWAVERPLTKRPRCSPEFTVASNLFYLKAVKGKYATIRLYVISHTIHPWGLLNVYLHIQDKEGLALPLSTYTDIVKNNEQCIWEYTETEIMKWIPDFLTEGILTFVFSFEEHSSTSALTYGAINCAAFTVQDHTDEKSVQTDDCEQVEVECQTVCDSSSILCLEGLSEDLEKLMEHTVYDAEPDLQLVCDDGEVLKVHKNIIRCRSMLLKDLESEPEPLGFLSMEYEDELPKFEVKGMDSETLKRLVRYIYTGTLPDMTPTITLSMYNAGHAYEVDKLVERCSLFLRQTLNQENALEVLASADCECDEDLKETAIAYVLEHEIPKDKDSWLEFSDGNLWIAHEIMYRFYQSQCNKQERKQNS